MKKHEQEIPEGYTRVTSVLKPYTDFSMIDPLVLARKADLGKRVHNYCESYSLGLFVEDVDSDCKNFVDAFKKWFDDSVHQVLYTETRINSPTYLLTGQFDMICVLKYDTQLTLVDYKTPDNSSPTWQLQTAAYQMLADEELGIKVDRRICVMLPKRLPTVKIVEYTEHERDKQKYLHALELYRFFYG
jgi:hypothetical protein